MRQLLMRFAAICCESISYIAKFPNNHVTIKMIYTVTWLILYYYRVISRLASYHISSSLSIQLFVSPNELSLSNNKVSSHKWWHLLYWGRKSSHMTSFILALPSLPLNYCRNILFLAVVFTCHKSAVIRAENGLQRVYT